jgi:ankyrin repeat protein
MPLPSGLMSKLLSEFIVASYGTHSARLAFTMAAFYSGALGSGIDRPWDVVAKTQWLLKAVELGSFAAVSGIISDKNSCQILEEFGAKILEVRQLFFNSPSIDYQTLVYRLRGFADMPDVESLNVLVFLGEAIPEEAERTITRLTYGKNERQQRIRLAIPSLSRLEVFNLNRDSDLQVVDSDAFDIVLSNASEITTAVYNNNLENFISLAESSGLKSGDSDLEYFMSLAIFNGSKTVVRYLLDQYHVDPNQSWGEMSHLNNAIVFRRQSMVELFLSRNAMIEPAFGNKPSALHLVPRDDDPKLATLLCEHLNTKGTLQAVLNSSTTDGDLAGFTPVYVAMMCRSWKVAQIFLDYGADPNDGEDGAKLLDMSVLPMSTPTPLSILQTLLQKGAKTDWRTAQSRSPLKMAIQSSNVLAVFHLLLHHASIIFADSTTAIEEAEYSVQEMQTGPRLEVLNVDGDLCPNGWEDCSQASSVILEMVRIASAKENDWKNNLGDLVSRSPETCRSKIWILDQQIDEATMLVEVAIPS